MWRRKKLPDAERSNEGTAAVQRGLELLSRRARTESDLRERIEERFTPEATEAALERLRALGYVDDEAWAASFLERARSRERSARLLRQELRTHGVPPELAAAAIEAHDDNAAALEAARRLSRRRRDDDPTARKRRLYSALARRGFSSAAIERALTDLEIGESRRAEIGGTLTGS